MTAASVRRRQLTLTITAEILLEHGYRYM